MPAAYSNAAGVGVSQTMLTRSSVTAEVFEQDLPTWLGAASDLLTITDVTLSQSWDSEAIPLKLDVRNGWLPVARKSPTNMSATFSMVVQEKDLAASPSFGTPGWFFNQKSNTEYPIAAMIYMVPDADTRHTYSGWVGNWNIQQESTSMPTSGIIICSFAMTPHNNVRWATIDMSP